MSSNLGKLKKIELREAWKHEAGNFTNWLAQQDNLRLLGDEIGFDIKLLQTEAAVGGFNVDILAEEEGTGKKIIIENQLEITDHDHLGKIVTYASGHNAKVIIWVVKEAREEHRQAMDWLNEHTDEDTEFYLVQIELWQIESSPFAPKFQIISKPNDWTKTVRSTETAELTDTKIKQLEFWTRFKEFAKKNNTKLRLQKSYPQHWTNISIGNSYSNISLTVNSREGLFGTELYIPDNKDLYNELLKYRSDIESKLGEKPEWMELPGKKASRIRIQIKGDFDNDAMWEEYFVWLQKESEKFYSVFHSYLNDLLK